MMRFAYDALPGRIVFGPGTRSSVIAEVEALGLRRVMVIADANAKHVADVLVDELGVMVASRWHEVAQHVPTELAEAARTAARDAQIDGIVCVGGGSTTGLAKAIALEFDAPIVAVPTTYAGSEVTPIFGLTGEHKQTGRALRVLPRVVVYDPELTLDVPMSITGPSALNAIAHSVEALYGPSTNPVTTLMAGESIRAIASALAVLAREPRDLEARTQLLYGAYLAGAAFAVVGIALHHKVCHVLGGTFGLVHGEVNAVMLPHVVAFNAPGAPDAIARVAAALDVDDAACGLFDLAATVGAPTSLAQLGMPEDALGRAAERTVAETTFNPVRVEVSGVLALLDDAWHGRRPSSVVSAGATNNQSTDYRHGGQHDE